MYTDENSNQVSGGGNQVATLAAVYNNIMNVKDSRWLQLEVCREFQRGQCSRTEHECKFAHPPPHVDVQNGKVTACYDSIKGRCTRENPKCKYLHPPQHLKDQLLINGRNNLAIKNMVMQQIANPAAAAQLAAAQQNSVMTTGNPGMQAAAPNGLQSSMLAISNPNMAAAAFAAMPGGNLGISIPSGYPYYTAVSAAQQQYAQQYANLLPQLSTSPDVNGLQSMQMIANAQQATGQPSSPAAMQKSRSDRVEALQNQQQQVAVQQQQAALAAQQQAAQNQVPSKRAALDKSGVPVYQPSASTSVTMSTQGVTPAYYNLAALQVMQAYPTMGLQPQMQQAAGFPAYMPVTFAGHPPSLPRF